MAADRLPSLAAGIIPADLVLPGTLLGRRRVVRISIERIRHSADRRPGWLVFCLTHMARARGDPDYLGYRPGMDRRSVEFVRHVGVQHQLLLIAVKFVEPNDEAWVSTAHPLNVRHLTRRIRAGTMHKVSRGP